MELTSSRSLDLKLEERLEIHLQMIKGQYVSRAFNGKSIKLPEV